MILLCLSRNKKISVSTLPQQNFRWEIRKQNAQNTHREKNQKEVGKRGIYRERNIGTWNHQKRKFKLKETNEISNEKSSDNTNSRNQ